MAWPFRILKGFPKPSQDSLAERIEQRIRLLFLLTRQYAYFKGDRNNGPKPAAVPPDNQIYLIKPRRLGVMETPEARGFFFWTSSNK
jgi:hypothetical protein